MKQNVQLLLRARGYIYVVLGLFIGEVSQGNKPLSMCLFVTAEMWAMET